MKRTMWVAMLLLLALVAAGCGGGAQEPEDEAGQDPAAADQEDEAGDTETEPVAGMANPASVNCEEKGGTVQIVGTDEGESGVCVFEDGSECEEWAFYRDECKPGDHPAGTFTS